MNEDESQKNEYEAGDVSASKHDASEKSSENPSQKQNARRKILQYLRRKFPKACEDWKGWTVLERTQIVFNGLLVVFTAIYAAVTIGQLCIMRRTLEYAERAWIVYVDTGPVSHPGEEKKSLDIVDGKLTVEVTFANAGRSPAFDVASKIGHALEDTRRPLSCSVNETTSPPVSRGVMAGNGTWGPIRPRVEIPITQDDLAALEVTKEKRLYIAGVITYKDEFLHPRKTQFCVVHTPNNEGGGFSYCLCGNVLE